MTARGVPGWVRPFFVDKFCVNVLCERCLCANFV